MLVNSDEKKNTRQDKTRRRDKKKKRIEIKTEPRETEKDKK